MSAFDSYDPEAVYQEADILQAQYEDESAKIRAYEKSGGCTHGSSQGVPEDRERFAERIAELEAAGVPEGGRICLDCGFIAASEDAYEEARQAALRAAGF